MTCFRLMRRARRWWLGRARGPGEPRGPPRSTASRSPACPSAWRRSCRTRSRPRRRPHCQPKAPPPGPPCGHCCCPDTAPGKPTAPGRWSSPSRPLRSSRKTQKTEPRGCRNPADTRRRQVSERPCPTKDRRVRGFLEGARGPVFQAGGYGHPSALCSRESEPAIRGLLSPAFREPAGAKTPSGSGPRSARSGSPSRAKCPTQWRIRRSPKGEAQQVCRVARLPASLALSPALHPLCLFLSRRPAGFCLESEEGSTFNEHSNIRHTESEVPYLLSEFPAQRDGPSYR